MMHLLLCASTDFEIQPTIDFIREERVQDIQVLITGVGMVATTHSLTKAIGNNRPDFILQAGIGGCLDRQLPLTKIVLVEHEHIGDLGVHENGKFSDLFSLGLVDQNKWPYRGSKLSNDVEALKSTGLAIVNGVTVNEISTNQERIDYYRDQLRASVESMEGAALHYVALQEQIRFLQMRALSNFAGERDKNNWVTNVAIAQLNLELRRIISKMLKL